MLWRDEVEDGEVGLLRVKAQAPADLLQVDHQTFGGAQHQNGIDLRDVDTLVVQIDGEYEVDAALHEVLLDLAALPSRAVSGQRGGG